MITKPTRITEYSSSLIDNIFTNDLNSFSSGVIYSDVFIISNNIKNIVQNKSDCIKFNFSSQNLRSVNLCLSVTDWSPVLNSNNVDTSFNNFITILHTVIKVNCPPLKKNRKLIKNPWFTLGLKIASKNKNNLYKKYLKNPNNENKLIYIKYKNTFTKIRRLAEKNYINDSLTKNKDNIKKKMENNKQMS